MNNKGADQICDIIQSDIVLYLQVYLIYMKIWRLNHF